MCARDVVGFRLCFVWTSTIFANFRSLRLIARMQDYRGRPQMHLCSMHLCSHVVMEVALGGCRIPAAHPLHLSTCVSAKMNVQRASPGPPLLNNLKDLCGPELFTVLPTLLAISEQGTVEHQHHFPDSSVMAHVAIIDTCLTDFYDVPHASLSLLNFTMIGELIV